ncbi:NAD(P)H-flavin reductase [Nonomuraea pusilla]|uniref:nitric oxide dioxygenase n=1 Tax=Nonomuraea pusilla TaxID=46177 RepID=A0A1H7FRI4_9ACTN|nr:NAD(P)H-flavin reductase [Nonomuraea pusilla]
MLGFQRVRDNFELVAKYGDGVPLYLFSDLFLRVPQLREMFPVNMRSQRERLMGALAFAVEHAGDLAAITPYLHHLARSHRKFGARPEHYAQWSVSVVNAMRRFSGSAWDDELEREWRDFLTAVSQVMIDAARQDGSTRPPHWSAEIISHERRAVDTAVIRLLVDEPFPYVPGQSAPVEVEKWPNMWRYYSMANVPRQDNTIEFHVKGDGAVSQTLVREMREGDTVKLGWPVGTLTLNPNTERNILLIAGGTGFAPIKALLEHVIRLPVPPWVSLFVGAREPEGLYDFDSVRSWAERYSWLSVRAALSEIPAPDVAASGTVAEVVSRYGRWGGYDAYVCGPAAMVEDTVSMLRENGFSDNRIRLERFALAAPPTQRFAI